MDSKPIYKTAAELGIAEWERDGLIALIGPLSRNELSFDMRNSCGSVCCIGGWVSAIADRSQSKYMGAIGATVLTPKKHPLVELYFPMGGWVYEIPYKASALQASKAIVNFLVTGDPQWSAVMAEG